MDSPKVMNERIISIGHGVDKCDGFISAKSDDKALIALQHVSQMVHVLPDEVVKGIINLGRGNKDFRVRIETCYLVKRWGKPEGIKLLSDLENDKHPEVRQAYMKLQASKSEQPEMVKIVENLTDVWNISHRMKRIKSEERQVLYKLMLMNLIKASGRSFTIFIGCICIDIILLTILCLWTIRGNIGNWWIFWGAFAIGLLSFELVLIIVEALGNLKHTTKEAKCES